MSQPLRCSKSEKNQLDKQFWDERWKTKDTGWDLESVSPPLKAYIDTIVNKEVAILIPGCGNAHEAAYLLENGFTNVSVIDISPTLVQSILQKFEKYAGKELTVICGDFFRHFGQYDIILEQTFFCALSPDLRKQYVEKMHSLLAENRKLVGLLFDKVFESNPPFGGSKNEYEELFSKYFEIETMEPCTNSIPPRAGAELFVEFRKKPIS
jgi:SAM-dependent methyltransferase